MKKASFLLLLTFLINVAVAQRSDSLEINILFIGNSLTYTNNLPQIVEKVAAEKGSLFKTKIIAKPNYALIDHWREGEIKKEIEENNYDFVIIQQGPSSQEEGRNMLINDGKKLKKFCEKYGSKLCYFMVWPSQTYYYTYAGVIKNYSDAASENDAILLPVGEVWKKHFDDTQNFDYYSEDGFHPSMKGSKAAAQIIVNCLLKHSGEK